MKISDEILNYYSRVKAHRYSDGKRAIEIIGITSTKGNVEIWYDVIYLDDQDEPDGIRVAQVYKICLDHVVDKLQRVKTVIRQQFTQKNKSIRKKYWTKLEKDLKLQLRG